MPRKTLDELLPLAPVLRRRHILLVPKWMQRACVRSELLRHETQLHKRPHLIFQQPVIYLVDVRKIVDGLARSIFVVESDFIVKNRVKPHVFKSRNALRLPQVLSVTPPQTKNRPPRPKHLFPKMWEGMRGGVGVNVDLDASRCR